MNRNGTWSPEASDKPVPVVVLTRLPPAPKRLSESARAAWREVGVRLVRAGLLADVDLSLLEDYATTAGVARDALAIVATEGQMVATAHGTKRHPALTTWEHALTSLRAIEGKLGFATLDRQRLRQPAAAEDDDEGDDGWPGV